MLVRRLVGFSRVIAFDKRGTGLSGRVVEIPTYEQQLDDMIAVLDAAGSSEAAVVGNFDGAVLATLFAATFPHRTRALVTWMMTPRVLRAPDFPWGVDTGTWEQWIAAAYQGFGLEDLQQRIAPSRAANKSDQDEMERFFRRQAGPGGTAAFMRMWGGMDIRPVLPLIRVPTLVLHRADANLMPAEIGRYVANTISEARYVEVPGDNLLVAPEDTDQVGDEIEEFLTGTRPRPEIDRVLATVLFLDIVGSTAQLVAVGDRKWRDRLDQHDAVVRTRLDTFRGREIRTTGDGFFAVFDGPARAIRCALAIIDDAHALGIDLRAGIHTGECEIRGDDYAGIAVHVGARIADLAGPREVLTSRTVKDLVAGSEITFDDRGEHVLKGVPEPWHIYRAT